MTGGGTGSGNRLDFEEKKGGCRMSSVRNKGTEREACSKQEKPAEEKQV